MSNDEEVFELPTDGVIGLLPPHESLVDLASYGPILVAQEECERNYEGDVLIVEDEEIQDTCCEVIGVSANLVFPCSNSFRFLNIQLKNLDKYTAIEVEVIDTERMRRKLQFTNSQSKTRITKQYVSMPLKLTKGWNHLSLDLDALLKAAFGTGLRKSLCKYRVVPLEPKVVALVSCIDKEEAKPLLLLYTRSPLVVLILLVYAGVQLFASIRLRRVYFSARQYSDVELPVHLRTLGK